MYRFVQDDFYYKSAQVASEHEKWGEFLPDFGDVWDSNSSFFATVGSSNRTITYSKLMHIQTL